MHIPLIKWLAIKSKIPVWMGQNEKEKEKLKSNDRMGYLNGVIDDTMIHALI